MKQSIKEELIEHVNDLISDGVLTLDNAEDWHFHAFNEGYYIIGYYQAEQWLKQHGVSVFDAVRDIQQYEIDNFGSGYTDISCPEKVVNMYVYIKGEEVLYEIQDELIQELEYEQETE